MKVTSHAAITSSAFLHMQQGCRQKAPAWATATKEASTNLETSRVRIVKEPKQFWLWEYLDTLVNTTSTMILLLVCHDVVQRDTVDLQRLL